MNEEYDFQFESKTKGEIVCKKFLGELGRPRKPVKEWDNREGLNQTLGKVLSDEQRGQEAQVELISNRDHYDRGLKLIAKHYSIAAPIPKSVIIDFVLPPDGAFWRELALKLLVDHVPFFGTRRRGRKVSLRGLLPLIDVILEGNFTGDNGEAAKELLAAFRLDPAKLPSNKTKKSEKLAKALSVELVTLKRELTRWRKYRGGNSAK
jgi:hypothetical protein